jgi:hypothetical protein
VLRKLKEKEMAQSLPFSPHFIMEYSLPSKNLTFISEWELTNIIVVLKCACPNHIQSPQYQHVLKLLSKKLSEASGVLLE